MKKLFNELVFGKNTKVSGLIALAVIGTIALGCNCGKNFDLSNLSNGNNAANTPANTTAVSTDGSVPSNEVVEGLVKETNSEFADAVDSGDFSDIHSYASTDFQNSYTVEQMTAAFKSYTDKKSVVLPILQSAEGMGAEFTKTPSIRTEKGLQILMAAGEFQTKPLKIRFDYEYVMRGGEWKLLKLIINIP